MSLAIAAIFKNEAPYLKEWIEYHQLVGVSHFYLYDNDSDDNWQEVVEPYRNVSVTRWPDGDQTKIHDKPFAWVYATHVPALEHAIQAARGKTEWIALIDLDEFLVPLQEASLLAVLDRYRDEVGLEVCWRIHGTSWVKKIPERSLLIETLTRSAPIDCPLNTQRKTILRPEHYKAYTWSPHRCSYKNGRTARLLDELVLHHYINRDETYLFSQKIKSKEKTQNCTFSTADIAARINLGNECEEESPLQRFVPALRQKLFPS